MKPKTIIGMIYAYDKDSNENSKLEYYIDGHADTFSIDLYNGTLWLDKKLDRETIDKYIIYVTVSDCGQPSLSTTAVITINVLDINDNAPLFFQSSYFLKVREDIPIGTRLMRISAFDQDENESGDIRYTIIDTENNTFAIDELTGNIRLHKSLDYEKIQLYNLTIMAMDEGKPPLSTNTYLIIEIEDVNENYYPPKFADFYDTAVVKENMPIGTFVTKVKAIDQDNPNLPLIYQIIGGNGLGRFTIDSNGNIYTSIVLDCEINSNFWLTIVAKDRAAVPLASFLELYIEIEDVNDMPPITKESFYTVNVLENIPIGSLVLQIEAYDQDFRLSKDKSNQILFNISDRQVPFEIDNKGHIRTTDKLDRETISRYVLDLDVMEPTITDSNQYNDDNQTTTFLKSRTPIIVNILDVNEFEPKSIMNTYRCYMYGKNIDRRLPVCQIIAYDQDDDDRCTLSYEIIEGNEKKFFHLDTNSGRIYSTKDIISKGNYDFVVQISDCNQPEPFTSTVHVIIRVLSVNIRDDNHKPSIEPFDSIIMINRNEDIGYTAAWIKSSDDDNDRLCYYIINGNIDDSFAFLDNGALVVTKSLKNQFINQFNLTLLATDGQDNSTINILVNIMNDYDDVMSFGQEKYVVNVFENITVGSDVIKLNVINDLNDQTSFAIYSTQSPETLTKFEVESWSGLIKIKNRLDYEQGKQHVILVEARSGRKHSRSLHQRTFTKVIINVIDVNDQSPQFITSHFETNVVESSSIGTSILQVQAFDTDYGNNAKINYTIISGNIDQTFDIEPDLGYIYIAKQLNFRQLSEYYLLVKANDQGQPSLSNTANVHILITLPDNSPPKFEQTNYVVDIREDEKVGTVILSIKMVNKQASFFTIIDGDMDKTFAINVNNGELYIRRPLDYEHCSAYQLTIEASNLIGANVTTKVFINIIDINDNAPYWNQTIFDGQIFETTPINTFVQTESGSPLVIHAYDKDSFYNLVYQIVEHEAREYFRIEPRTGAISLIQMLDCDKHQQLQFSVSVIDDGTPKLKSTNDAMVRIRCLPVNDCPPVFVVDKFHATLYLPTFPNVIITKVTAMDCDFNPDKNNGENLRNEQNPDLKYYLKSSPKLNDNVDDELAKFWINSTTGQIMTTKSEIKLGLHEIFVTVSDGKFTAEAKVFINVKLLPISTLKFRQKRFQASIQENSSNLRTILMPNIEGNKLHEHLIYRIMTPTNLFKIARTSGAILYRGIPVDRETTPKFELAIEVQSISIRNRIAQTLIEINVEDINDNQPKFVGLPYQFVFNSDSNIGDMIGKIQAVDMDDGINGKIHYSIISGDPMNLFALNTITGHLTIARQINQNFIDNNNNPINYTLLVMAKDLGKPSMNSMINVTLRMITGGIPLFQQSYYNVTINENYPPMLPFLTIKAESSHGRQIFYQIEAGNDNDEFLLDFNTDLTTISNTLCTISVVEKLDRETTSQYNLLISATDAISDTSSTVNVYIKVEDINDNQPMFTKFYYNVSIPENLMVGSPVLRVEAYDPDSGANSRLQYHLMGISMNKSHFYISPDEGIIYLKKSLDYELESFYHFEIIVNDYGSVQLTSTAQVWIEILDINDNSPILPATFTTTIDEDIESDGFVTKIIGYDADQSDQDKLRYKIISGSNMAFKIDETTGSIYVKNLKNSRYLYHHHHHNQQHNHHHHNDHITKHHYKLNISLTDGIYSTTETYSIIIRPVNNFSPRFHRILNNVAIGENQPIGTSLLFVNATDNDDNIYGQIEYHILNDYGRKFFNMDQITGEIRLKMELDYEKDDKFYWLILGAQDRGKRIGISALRIALIDQNDNGPRFIVDEYKCSICANVPVDSTILSILALDDDDDPENTVIQYSIYDDANDLDSTTMMNQINDYVEIASDTGYIYIRKNLTQLIGKRIQFFVKAFNVPGNVRNNIGKNIQKRLISNVVPITIEIVDSCDYHKREAFLYEVFVKENIERGSIVASLNLANYKDVEIEIVGLDQRSDSNKFRIDSDGRIYVNEPLDREIKSKHILALRVYDKIYHITDYFYVIINIMDENDCTPYFDSASYYLSLAENQEIGSTIFKMTALDNDIDLLNNALKYNLRNDHDGTFRIDENSGWISLTKQLDRESIEHYNLQIDITDGLHSNSTSLYIAVYDVNDNKPMIEPVRSIAAIYENSFLGTVILRIKVDDPDMNPELRYYISKGDHLHHFAISSSGDVYVNKTLDRETIDQYSLKILVTDGKYYTESELLIDVLDVNDNGPICVKSKYVEMVSESVPIGTHILTVEAVDQDDAENGKLYFVLDGDHKNHFIVDSFTGRLKTNAKLDREHQSIYLFNVIVYDYQNREWHCTSNVEILLSDINDEPPRFLMQLNSVHVPEDSPVGMILGKVSAIDLDIGPNRQIIYELIESTGEFLIHENSGIIRLAKTLDRESCSFYNLTIMAYDVNMPILNSTTYFTVNVTDINDNAPEFEMQTYKANIDENVVIGTEVIRIFATSKDTGINAEIRYKIINGNVNDTFLIDSKTGSVTVANDLDYEQSNEYFLIIEAKDQGIPPLSSEVNLLINVNDINDMRPQFSQRSYDIVIREDAQIGDKIYQIVASDGDSPPNANLTYSFENDQLSYKEFNIEPLLGILTVAKQLDREMISSYILEIFCSDNGKPIPFSASVFINIEISDYNDNPPLFDKINQTIHLKENRPIGFKFFEFNIYDPDSSLNSGPFKFEFIEGNNDEKFIINDNDCSLRTNTIFNHYPNQSDYKLVIKVTDSGNPPLSTIGWLNILIIQESKTPPKVHPLSITINSLDHFPGGLIGQINATDDDPFDKLTYSLTNSEDNQNIFAIDNNEGFIRALPGLDIGKYQINVTVSDEKFQSWGIIEIEVIAITESMIENAMVIQIYSIKIQDFLNNFLKNFIRSMKALFKVTVNDVIVLSIQQIIPSSSIQRHRRNDGQHLLTSDSISLMFAITTTNNDNNNPVHHHLSRETIRAKLLENKYFVENQIGLTFDVLSQRSQCHDIKCENGECREELYLSENQITYAVSQKFTFVSPYHEFRFGCACHTGFGGIHCNETVNECYRNPCPANKECLPVSSSLGYVCQCPFGKSGIDCNQNAETCQANERDVLVCYQEFNPISFNGRSYVRYLFVKKIDKLSFRFRTQQLRARILTQQNDQSFVILEIVAGYLQYRFNCGEGEGLIRVHNLFVSDGKWHEIIVERKDNTASLLLDRKYRSGGFAPGASNSCLNRLKSDIYFGGDVKSNSDNVVGDEEILYGFNGCLDNILFNGQQIPFHKTSRSAIVILKTLANIEFSCTFKTNTGACRSQPCMNGGQCENLTNGSYVCQCPGHRYRGHHCEIDSLPCSISPCQNDGICVTDLDACENNQSPHCYKCQCRNGFTGINCQLPNHCSANFCHNGGVCEETSIGPKCHCHTGWHGLYCEQDIDECHLNTPACHSTANCINLPGTFRCVCPINSTIKCNGHSLLTTNLIESYFHISYKEMMIVIIILIALVFIAFFIVLCCTCCNRPTKKKPKQEKNNDASESLLNKSPNHRISSYNENCDHQPIITNNNNKDNNFEMTNMTNNISAATINHHHQIKSSVQNYQELFNNTNNDCNSILNSEDYDQQTPVTIGGGGCGSIIDYTQNFKKNAPIASVSPQMIETIKQSSSSMISMNSNNSNSNNKDKKNRKRSKMVNIHSSTGNRETHRKRTSLNDSSDSNVTNSTQTEGYHWDTSDLYLADGNHNQHNHAENFTHVVQYNFDNSNIINGNDNDDDDSLNIPCSPPHPLLNATYVKSKIRNIDQQHNKETSPLLVVTDNPDNSNEKNQQQQQQEDEEKNLLPSPPLEIKLGSKLEFSRNNYIERYLPKHDDNNENQLNYQNHKKYSTSDIIDYDLNVDKMEKLNGNGKQQSLQPQQQQRNRNRNDSSGSIQSSISNQQIKPVTLLTFNRSSLNESADNFSLLTPSSSCSTTPIAALINSSSASDTIDQCSSSMSSSSNNDLKISPLNSSIAFMNGSESSSLNTIIKNNHYHHHHHQQHQHQNSNNNNNGNSQTMANIPLNTANGNGNHNYNGASTTMMNNYKMTSFSYPNKQFQQPTINVNGNNSDKETTNGNHIEIKNSSSGMTGNLNVNDNNDTNTNTINGDDSTKKDVDCNQQQQQQRSSSIQYTFV
ncbi:fat-like cadherin-related tumor suppressor homolog isoform X1 [Dermatophagoides pteronyssinus]|uniref:fat-like cadherin-related tumor suppressor homolog isoform X1 n=1 Tax=Dermatophagoides pteronyssinus TaxID=6956 RepID=UPI003F67D0C1